MDTNQITTKFTCKHEQDYHVMSRGSSSYIENNDENNAYEIESV